MAKKVGVRGVALNSQGRELIFNVSEFMKEEAKHGISIPIENHRERILVATGISKSTYQRILNEYRRNQESGASTSFRTPPKTKQRDAPKLDFITPSQVKTIREVIYDFYIYEKRRPTLKCIHQKINSMQILSDNISVSSLRKFLMKTGFRWHRTKDTDRTALIESNNIRLKRINYLKKISEYRNKGRKIIYADETYIHSSRTQGWNDEIYTGLKKPTSKGQSLIIVHAGSEDGFIDDCLLIFPSGTKTGDFHNEMNPENFIKWVENYLLPNLPQNSVLVVDNAPYHNVPSEKQITSGSLRSEMIDWLEEKNISADPKLTKPELYNIIKANKVRFPIKYKLDELMEKNGHSVLRLPPYHQELNPIEKLWETVKSWVASRNTTFKLTDVEVLIRQKFDEIGTQEWLNVCNYVKNYENQLIEKEEMFDSIQETLQFTAKTESSSEESESESEYILGCESDY